MTLSKMYEVVHARASGVEVLPTRGLWAPREKKLPLEEYVDLVRMLGEAAPSVLPGRITVRVWDRVKFIGRGLLFKRWLYPWLVFLGQPRLFGLATYDPGLFLRIQWPYINRRYGAARRFALVHSHYTFLLRELSADLLNTLFSGRPLTLARWNIAALGPYRLVLRHVQGRGQEGELAVNLECAADGFVAHFLQFTVGACEDGEPELVIGGLQGGAPDGRGDGLPNKALAARLTRYMHGSRPKNLLLHALRCIAEQWGISRIRAVSNEQHIYRENLRTDYDAFWREVGGIRQGDGMFIIPRASSSLADVALIPARRRSLYRRRCRLWQAIREQIVAALQPGVATIKEVAIQA